MTDIHFGGDHSFTQHFGLHLAYKQSNHLLFNCFYYILFSNSNDLAMMKEEYIRTVFKENLWLVQTSIQTNGMDFLALKKEDISFWRFPYVIKETNKNS